MKLSKFNPKTIIKEYYNSLTPITKMFVDDFSMPVIVGSFSLSLIFSLIIVYNNAPELTQSASTTTVEKSSETTKEVLSDYITSSIIADIQKNELEPEESIKHPSGIEKQNIDMADLIFSVFLFFAVICLFIPKGYPKARIDLTNSEDSLQAEIQNSLRKLNKREFSYREIKENIAEKKNFISELNKSKAGKYLNRLEWKWGYYNKTKDDLKILAYSALFTVFTFLLHLTTDTKKENLVDVACIVGGLFFIIMTFKTIITYFNELMTMKRMTFKEFFSSQNEYHNDRLRKMEADIVYERDGCEDIERCIDLLQAEIKLRTSVDVVFKKIKDVHLKSKEEAIENDYSAFKDEINKDR